MAFALERDEHTGYLLGRIISRRKRDSTGRRQFDMEQLLILFRPILDGVVHQMSRSTPLADRKSIAAEAMCTAAQEYRPGYGDLGAYLEDRIKSTLHKENKQYIEAFGQRSLDQPLSCGDSDDFCLYDTLPDVSSDWTDSLDNQIDRERFFSRLSSEHQELVRLLQEGFRISEIADIFDISEGDVRRISAEIVQQRRKFDGEA